jgi:hypothetical protein
MVDVLIYVIVALVAIAFADAITVLVHWHGMQAPVPVTRKPALVNPFSALVSNHREWERD